MKKIFVFGNGNLSFQDFSKYYIEPLENWLLTEIEVGFILCDFRGVDTLMMEYLKTYSKNVWIYHIGEKPRYKPDAFRTFVNEWNFVGGFQSDAERDQKAIEDCTCFLAKDFNSDETRVSGTSKNISKCFSLNKIAVF